MKTLDLHGIKHSNAPEVIEEFLLQNIYPFESVNVITGNSSKMLDMLKMVVEKNGFVIEFETQGRLIIGY